MAKLNEMENEGYIVFGRGIRTVFPSSDAVEKAADEIERIAIRYRTKAELIYCGTTINWPEDEQYTPIMVGEVLYEWYGDDNEEYPGTVPPKVFSQDVSIDSGFWKELEDRLGLQSVGGDALHLAVAGWAWVRLDQNGKKIMMISAEDYGYKKLKNIDPSKGEITMVISYC